MKIAGYILIASLGLAAVSCDSLLDPEPDNRISEELLLKVPQYAEGLLLNAYNELPADYRFFEDIASDDAVSNNLNSPYIQMATGQWKAENYPLSKWEYAFKQIFYINSFLQKYGQVVWSWEDDTVNELNYKRLTGEIYGLRAWYQFLLLQYHGGEGKDGRMLGFPIQTKALRVSDDWKQARNTYTECIAQILADCDSAILYLPDNYISSGTSEYNQAMGSRWTNRITANAAQAIKSRTLLYAASPSFNTQGDITLWEKAAIQSGNFLNSNGGLAALSPGGLRFYIYTGKNDADVIWSRAIISNVAIESINFPPSLLGQGTTNPTQEIVDAFPMSNGYPISHELSGYDPLNPYGTRDPRLAAYILYNGNTMGAKGAIYTHINSPMDGINVQTNSTRTGYYLKKFLLDGVNVENPVVKKNHFYTYFRFTEIFLNYAEAANEAWGPDGDEGSIGFSARTVISAIRTRAGIPAADPYLASLASKEDFRELIKNERRLELCFEGHRFWDIRRWMDILTMKKPVSGVFIDNAVGSYTYQVVEGRNYENYMVYGPVPLFEIAKYPEMIQNEGW